MSEMTEAQKLLVEYHAKILEQRAVHNKELIEVLNGIRYTLNDILKALIVRNKI